MPQQVGEWHPTTQVKCLLQENGAVPRSPTVTGARRFPPYCDLEANNTLLGQYPIFSELVWRRRLRRASTTIFRRMAAPFARAVEACSCPREPDAPCRLCPRHWPGTLLRRRD